MVREFLKCYQEPRVGQMEAGCQGCKSGLPGSLPGSVRKCKKLESGGEIGL